MEPSIHEGSDFTCTGCNQRKRPWLIAVHVMLITLIGGFRLLQGLALNDWCWDFATGLTLCLILSLVLRAGWIAPCMTCGIFLGIMSTLRLRGGPAEVQAQDDVIAIVTGAFFGLVVGWLLDIAQQGHEERTGS